MFERGPFVSFANCGLPYYVGNVITEERKLLVASPQLFKERFNIDVRTQQEVVSIDRVKRRVTVRNLQSDAMYEESYDALLLAPGGEPLKPALPGIDLEGIFSLRTIPDSRKIRQWIEDKHATRAVIGGAGFIGLEMAENLVRRGLSVSMIEMASQVMPSLDPEMAAPVARHLKERGVDLCTGDGLGRFERGANGDLIVYTTSGRALACDIVILGLGIRPATKLAKLAGLQLGSTGAIRVDGSMQTSDPAIWAVGDAVEVTHVVSGTPHIVPLAGPANRQGRLAADAIVGRKVQFRGVQSTAVCGVFDWVIAQTGATEKGLRAAGMSRFSSIYLHPGHHVGYYPGAKPIHLKLTFDLDDGRVLGAQAVGQAGVERRIDVLAMAVQMGATVYDLEQAELCYAPQFGAAKDPVNIAGMIAANHLRGDLPLAQWSDLPQPGVVIVDVREEEEFAKEHVPGAVNIPLSQLRERAHELAKDKPLWLHCAAGQRSYYATRTLLQLGYDAHNLNGGFETYLSFRDA